MIVAVDQPDYIPWKGHFDLIHDVELFVFYNDVQYTVRDWRNRNKIITPNGEKWLSVPCGNDTSRLIYEVKISDHSWQKNHYDTIKFAYGKRPHYDWVKPLLDDVYLDRDWEYLYELDMYMTERISRDYLGMTTKFADSRDYKATGAKHDRLISLLESIQADVYESGPTARGYIVPEDYVARDIELRWKSYDGFPEYDQGTEVFNHNVSIIDLLCNVGPEAPYYIWGWREDNPEYPAWVRDRG